MEYAGDEPGSGWTYLGLAQCYLLPAEPGDGAEVLSLLGDSDLAPDEYLDVFFDIGSARQRAERDSTA